MKALHRQITLLGLVHIVNCAAVSARVGATASEGQQEVEARFAAFAALPLPHMDAALKELARGLDDLGMAGATGRVPDPRLVATNGPLAARGGQAPGGTAHSFLRASL